MSDSIFNKFPILTLERITLRELRPFDEAEVARFYEYVSDPKVYKYISEEDVPTSLESAREELSYWADLFRYRRSIYWGITLKGSDELIGTCGFNLWSRAHRRAEVSYDLNRKYWGKGLMTEALQGMCDYGFCVMNLNRIQATVALDNIASLKVLQKLNFRSESTMREYGILRGKKYDFHMMALLSSEILF